MLESGRFIHGALPVCEPRFQCLGLLGWDGKYVYSYEGHVPILALAGPEAEGALAGQVVKGQQRRAQAERDRRLSCAVAPMRLASRQTERLLVSPYSMMTTALPRFVKCR
jgi:hypothetical protein